MPCCSNNAMDVVEPNAIADDKEIQKFIAQKSNENKKRVKILLVSTAEQVEMHEHQTLEGLTLDDLDKREPQPRGGKAVDFGMYMRGSATASHVSDTDFDSCTLVSDDDQDDLVVEFRQPWHDDSKAQTAEAATRSRTRGLVQTDIKVKSFQFCIFDVSDIIETDAGWKRVVHMFSGSGTTPFGAGICDVCIHVVDLGLYDQTVEVMDTDPNKLCSERVVGGRTWKNGLEHALYVWQRHVTSLHFRDTSYAIIFTNKHIMAEKLKARPFRECLDALPTDPRFSLDDETDAEQCAEYIKRLFLTWNTRPTSDGHVRTVFTHITGEPLLSATCLKFLFNTVVAIILESNLRACGMGS